jgi:hypothetical protein
VSVSAVCDAMMRRHGHRADVVDLVSPAPERGLLGQAATIQFLPLRADLVDAAQHDFSPMLDRAVGDAPVLEEAARIEERDAEIVARTRAADAAR